MGKHEESSNLNSGEITEGKNCAGAVGDQGEEETEGEIDAHWRRNTYMRKNAHNDPWKC
jgi:hypothetical protein